MIAIVAADENSDIFAAPVDKNDPTLTKKQIDGFKASYNLLKDYDLNLNLQKISKQNTATYSGKIFSLEGKPLDVFTSDATYMRDGVFAAIPTINTLQNIDGDDIVTITKNPDGQIKNVIIFNKKIKNTVELVNVGVGVLGTIQPKDFDLKHLNRKFRYGESNNTEPKSKDIVYTVDASGETRAKSSCVSFRKIDLAIAYESSFCAAHSSNSVDADNAATSLVGLVSTMYEQEDLCVKVKISHLEGYCDPATDPYTQYVNLNNSGCSSDGLLQGFGEYWNRNRVGVARDTAHLLSGTGLECDSDGSCVIGCAGLGVTCYLEEAYGVNHATFSSSDVLNAVLVARELGHNNGADLYFRPGYVMYPIVGPTPNGFSSTSIDAFNQRFSSTSCIGRFAPPGPTASLGASPTSTCGNGICEAGLEETCFTCFADCGTSSLCKFFSADVDDGTYSYSKRRQGQAFDIKAINDVTIYALDLMLDYGSSDPVTGRVYTKVGGYVGDETWIKVFDGTASKTWLNGLPAATFVFDNTIRIKSGHTKGIYVVLTEESDLLYRVGTQIGNSYGSNTDLEVFEGQISLNTFAFYFTAVQFTGSVRYMDGTGCITDVICNDGDPLTRNYCVGGECVNLLDNDTLSPSSHASSEPSSVPSVSTHPSFSPSSGPTEDDESSESPEVRVTIQMKVILDVENPPTDDAGRSDFAAVAKPALIEASGGKDVEVKGVGGVPVSNVFRTIRAGVKVDFDVLLKIKCDGSDCSSAFDAVADLANDVVSEVSDSMSNGSFAKALVKSANALGVDDLKEVTVDATSFSSEDPVTVSTGGSATFSPTIAPTIHCKNVISRFMRLF